MQQHSMRAKLLVLAVSCGLAIGALTAQEPGTGGRGQFAGMQRVTGVVTGVSGDTVTVKTEDGTIYQVATTANTRMRSGKGGTLKVSDLKTGDGVLAVGNMDVPNKTLHAAILGATDAEQLKKMRENLGKTYITGRITAIDTDNLKITVQRPDGVSQTIGLDESTSFKRGGRGGRGGGMAGGGLAASAPAATPAEGVPTEGGESITLADVKVGDNVMGPGTMKNGVFVPTQLNVGRAGPGRRARGDGAAGKPAAGAGDGAVEKTPQTPQ